MSDDRDVDAFVQRKAKRRVPMLGGWWGFFLAMFAGNILNDVLGVPDDRFGMGRAFVLGAVGLIYLALSEIADRRRRRRERR